jgi:hypothetical protein
MPEKNSSSGPKGENEKELSERKADATSKETLKDLEETEKNSNSTGTRHPAPSPDGSLDEADEVKDAGPM